MGIAYYKLNENKKAEESLQKAIELRADNAEARLILGYVFLRKKDTKSALEQYRWLIFNKPDLGKKLFNAIYSDKILDVRKQKRSE